MIPFLKYFFAFILPFFEYYSPVWCSGSNSHLRLLDHALGNIRFLLPDLSFDLEDRRKIASLSLLYKILNNIDYLLHCKLLQFAVPTRTIWQTSRQNERSFVLSRHNTTQFSRCFINSKTKLWNSFPNNIVLADKLGTFKTLAKCGFTVMSMSVNHQYALYCLLLAHSCYWISNVFDKWKCFLIIIVNSW